jgi:hypothetical protein
MPEFAEWDSFYGIVGSAAGTLIGLQFVVMTLVAEKPSAGVREIGPAFSTPTIVHFGTLLLLAALLRAPWHGVGPIAALWGLIGAAGALYTAMIGRRLRRQLVYRPDAEDWLFHIVLPWIAYAGLALLAIVAPAHLREALFGIAAAALLLLFTGIHNAWDAVAYHVFVRRHDTNQGPIE